MGQAPQLFQREKGPLYWKQYLQTESKCVLLYPNFTISTWANIDYRWVVRRIYWEWKLHDCCSEIKVICLCLLMKYFINIILVLESQPWDSGLLLIKKKSLFDKSMIKILYCHLGNSGWVIIIILQFVNI